MSAANGTSVPVLTKILATIGPACRDPMVLVRMIEEGARVIRINFSHGSFEDFEASVEAVREASEITGVPIGVLGDLSGPKIRINQVKDDELDLKDGDHVEFVKGDGDAFRDPKTGVVYISCNYPLLVHEVQPGHRLLINDGAIRTLVTDKVTAGQGMGNPEHEQGPLGPRLVCSVTHGGKLTAKKGVNLPDTDISTPSLTDYDEKCVRWAVHHELDFLALSFVRKAEDVRRLKLLLREMNMKYASRTVVIAKIETPQAAAAIGPICEVSDAIMVARGDLGVEMELTEVPITQKRIIRVAHDYGRPVIVATQMLQTMIDEAAPTRAEVSDVANAIIDGADAIMLSGETAVGKYPVAVVQTMSQTARKTEGYHHQTRPVNPTPPRIAQESRYRTAALAHGVSVITRDLDARFVVTWSELADEARFLSQNRLHVPILALSSNTATLRRMALMFGVLPVWMPRPADSEGFLREVDRLLVKRDWAELGDPVVIVKGEPLGTPGVTNQIQVHYLGDVCRLTWRAKME